MSARAPRYRVPASLALGIAGFCTSISWQVMVPVVPLYLAQLGYSAAVRAPGLVAWSLAAVGAAQDLNLDFVEYQACYRSPAGSGMGMGFAVWKPA